MAAQQELSGQLGRYRILKKIGAGGMGAVYLAEDVVLSRRVALKVPHFDTTTKPAVLERFQREARLAARIDHPNLCAVFDVGEVDGVHYFIMPFIEGRTLDSLIDERRPWPSTEAAELVRRVSLAVDKLHQHGIVHRDLKPANIMVRDSGDPVLMDFGLALPLASHSQRLTVTGAPMGSPAYMAPEQVLGKEVSQATDVYGLGVILYELLTGRLPFEGPAMSLFAQILHDPVRPPSERCVGLDPRLDWFCVKALAKNPDERFADMSAFADMNAYAVARAEVTRHLSTPVVHELPEPSALTLTAPAVDTDGERTDSAPMRQPLGLLATVWTSLVLAFGLVVLFYLSLKDEKEPELQAQVQPSEPPPDPPSLQASLEIAPLPALTLLPGESKPVRIRCTRTNCPGLIAIELVEPVAGIGLPNALLSKDENEGQVVVSVAENAVDGKRTLKLRIHGAATTLTELTVEVKRPDQIVHVIDIDGVKIPFVFVAEGSFWMGSPMGEPEREPIVKGSEPQDLVRIREDFFLGKYEVTQEQWFTLMDHNPSNHSRGGMRKNSVREIPDEELKQFPVEGVSWNDIQKFLEKLNEREKDRNRGWVYRLPTEEEWEYACRGGPQALKQGKDTAPFYFARPSFTLSGDQANFDGTRPYGDVVGRKNLQRTCKVGSYEANALGLHDMHGNAWEWCDNLILGLRVMRGGGWRSPGSSCRTAYRPGTDPETRDNALGFRLARVRNPKK